VMALAWLISTLRHEADILRLSGELTIN